MRKSLEDLLPNRRVLIVEDEPRMRDMLVRALPDMGFTPIPEHSAEKAARTMAADPCSIALLDLNLPGEDGMSFFETIRRKWPRTQVIILTGFGDLDAAKRSIHLDVVDFLTKPCPLSDLESALTRAFDRAREQAIKEGLPPEAGLQPASSSTSDVEAVGGATEDLDTADDTRPRTMQEIERDNILAALARHDGNRSAAADELGISVRTIYYRLSRYQNS